MADFAYKTLCNAIINSDLKPGDKLIEAELSNQMEMSRAPLREALKRLESEGFIISSPYRGKIVADISPEELNKVFYPLRFLIEDYACQKARESLSKEDYGSLLAVIDKLKDACNKNDLIAVVGLDLEFHRIIVKKTVSNGLYFIWNNVSSKICNYLIKENEGLNSLFFIVDQHIEFYNILKKGSPEDISKYLRIHFDI